jgi:hypothetical protein
MKKIFLILFVFILSSNNYCFGQKMKKGIDHPFNVETVFEANSIVYYGWDFSNFKITDPRKINDGEIILRKDLPALIGELNEYYPAEKISKHLKKEVSENLGTIQRLIQNSDPETLVIYNTYEFSIDTVKKIIQAYDLPEEEGIGFVILLETFNKPKRYVTGYATFFDIESRNLLWSVKMKGNPGSKYGFVNYLFNGFTEVYAYFMADYYKKQERIYKRNKK